MFDIVYRAYHYYMRAKNSLDIAERLISLRDDTESSYVRIGLKVYIQYELDEARRQLKWACKMIDHKLK